MNQEFTEHNHALAELLQDKLSGKIKELRNSCGDIEIRIKKEDLKDVVQILKMDSELDFNFLVSVTVVDYLDSDFFPRAEDSSRYDAVYHFLSISKLHRLRVKAAVEETDSSIDSLCGLYESANFMEREAWDMYGVTFNDHPNLKRILMYDEFKGHPLRKDYPLQGKQPRVKLISPEVKNTARDMKRPDLVKINNKKGVSNG